MKFINDRDSHFFLAGWNGARRDVNASEHFKNASETAPASCLRQIQEPAAAQKSERWCKTMDRPAASCGCPDCGSSLIDFPTQAAPAAVAVLDALREAESALEVAIARILKAYPGHSISVTSEAKALVAVRAALAATKGNT